MQASAIDIADPAALAKIADATSDSVGKAAAALSNVIYGQGR